MSSKVFLSRLAFFVIAVCVLVAICSCGASNGSSTSTPSIPTTPTPVPNGIAPTVSGISVLPGVVGLVGVTNFTFQPSGVSNPSGDPVSFSWSFGDGTMSGQTVSHTYQFANTYSVQVTASNKWGSNQSPPVSLQAKTLTGEWNGFWFYNIPISLLLVQSGSNVSGTAVENNGGIFYHGSVTSVSIGDSNIVMKIRLALDANPDITLWSTVSASFLNGINEMKGWTASGTEDFDVVRK